jgi:hypothetical protein
MDGKEKAFSMTIGPPPEPAKDPAAPKEFTQNYPLVKVLLALITRGGIAEWRPIAVSISEDQLHRAAGEWVSKYKEIWGGKMKTVSAPFVIEAE